MYIDPPPSRCVHVGETQGHNLCSSHSALKELKKFEVNTLVRVCEATYDKAPVEREGIQVLVSTVVQVSLRFWLT